ncbi:MAG: hypothetical protein K8F91_03895 [Candidatus Obscuribacterales bacterium]|nr:hypothetical protein [Candidatus Obscuribacterales bacterium]
MNAAVKTNTRGIVQISRESEKVWTCSIVIYGEAKKLNTISLGTKEVINLFRTLGAPAPVSSKERHIVEFYNAPAWAALKDFGFQASA